MTLALALQSPVAPADCDESSNIPKNVGDLSLLALMASLNRRPLPNSFVAPDNCSGPRSLISCTSWSLAGFTASFGL